jgi:hypothetical protein
VKCPHARDPVPRPLDDLVGQRGDIGVDELDPAIEALGLEQAPRRGEHVRRQVDRRHLEVGAKPG